MPALVLTTFAVGCAAEETRPLASDESLTPFEEIRVDFEHRWDESTHPFSGAAVIDVDGDGADELFVGGGEGQHDVILGFAEGVLQRMGDLGTSSTVATHGATAIDIDDDGDTDLIVARRDGVRMYLNDAGSFAARLLDLDLDSTSVPLAVAVSDIDRDGHLDMYISVFVAANAFRSAVFNDPSHAKRNVMLRNNGDLTFTDVTRETGTGSLQNTFMSMFVDLNGDRLDDLIVSQNTGQVEIYANRGGLRFERIENPSGFGFWMGAGAGDVDGDGDIDLLFSNIGNSIPAFLTKGDLRDHQRHALEWLLLRNDGQFTFSDATSDYGLTGYGFAWGAAFEDIDLDGQPDLLVAQNYLKWPVHRIWPLPGKVLVRRATTGRPEYMNAPMLGLENPYFGQSPIIVDLDSDGRHDVVWLNMNGPLRALLNRSTNNFLTVRLPDNGRSLGAELTLHIGDGHSVSHPYTHGQGLMTDQSASVTFGLGGAADVRSVAVRLQDGEMIEIQNPPLNSVVTLSNADS